MNSQLEDLLYQCDREADFSPIAHLCILTDTDQVRGPLHVMMTDLVHTCLSNYFLPHRGAPSVSWVQRNSMKERMVHQTQLELNQNDCPVDQLHDATRISQQLDDADAIFFINKDACAFIKTHRNSFLLTLATCLRSSPGKIMMLDMTFKPLNIL